MRRLRVGGPWRGPFSRAPATILPVVFAKAALTTFRATTSPRRASSASPTTITPTTMMRAATTRDTSSGATATSHTTTRATITTTAIRTAFADVAARLFMTFRKIHLLGRIRPEHRFPG